MRVIAIAAALFLVVACKRSGDQPAAPPAPVDISVWLAQPLPEGTAEQQSAEAARKACLASEGTGCADVGRAYEQGVGVAQDLTRARAAYERGCDMGQGLACAYLAVLYRDGKGVPADGKRAIALMQRGCDQRSALACARLGAAYADGWNVDRDLDKARQLFESTCNAGLANGCTMLGVLLSQEAAELVELTFLEPDPAWRKALLRAEAPLRKGCDGGDAEGCNQLGAHYSRRAHRPSRDLPAATLHARASEAFGKACLLGIANACASQAGEEAALGNEKLALELYRKSCDGGDGSGCVGLAETLHERNAPGDRKAAVAVFTKACDGGAAQACKTLGHLHQLGSEEVPKDPARARAVFLRLCELDPGACSVVADVYCRSVQVPVDRALAVAMYQQACERLQQAGGDAARGGDSAAVSKEEVCGRAKFPQCTGDAPLAPLVVEKASGADARTIAEIHAQRAALKGKNVTVRGQVLKFTANVLGTNWVRLQDGSDGSKELTVTTADRATAGDVVTASGTLSVDHDFGAGYVYPVIIEGAKLTR